MAEQAEYFINVLRNNDELSESLVIHKTKLEQLERNGRDCVKYGEGIYATISRIWNNLFPNGIVEFTIEHELALRDYILVEKFGWAINDGRYWVLNPENNFLRRTATKFQRSNNFIGSQVTRAVRRLRMNVNLRLMRGREVINYLYSSN